jgi:hypothetical protein
VWIGRFAHHVADNLSPRRLEAVRWEATGASELHDSAVSGGKTMKAKKTAFYCLAALLAGCGPVFSLHPLFTEEDIVFDEQLLGTWVQGPDKSETSWEFARLNEADVGPVAKDVLGSDVKRLYRLTVTSKEDDKVHRGSVVACLGKLNGRMFLDVFPDKFPSGEQEIEEMPLMYNAFFFVPVHTFIQVDRTGDQLKLRLTDNERFAKLLEAEPTAVKHEKAMDDRRVLTASTKELQTFVLKHAGDDRLFADATILTRKSE